MDGEEIYQAGNDTEPFGTAGSESGQTDSYTTVVVSDLDAMVEYQQVTIALNAVMLGLLCALLVWTLWRRL